MGVYDLPTAQQKVTDYATTKWGRGPQDQNEWSKIGQGINYGDGVDDNELTQAYGNADSYAKSLGATPLTPETKTSPAPTPPPQGQTSPIQSAFQQGLLSMMDRAQQTPSLADPTLKAQSDAFRGANQRSTERRRMALAERMAAEGTATSGGFDTGVDAILADEGAQQGQFDAGLVGGEVQARRGEMMQALQLATASGNAEAARALQRELAQLDAGLRTRGLDIQETLGGQDLGVRRDALNQQGQLGRGDLALRLWLGMQGNQLAYDQMGLGASQWLANFNQNNFLNYLGGI